MALIIISKAVFLTKSSLLYLGNQFRVFTQLFIQACEFSFFSCIHFWLNFFFEKFLYMSTIFNNIFFITFYFLLFAIHLYDYQNCNINEQEVLFSTMKAYLPIFTPHPKFSFPLDLVPRNNYNSLSFITDVFFAIVDEPIFWVVFLSFFTLFFVYCIYIIVKFKSEICFSLQPDDDLEKKEISCAYTSLIEPKFHIDVSDFFNFDTKYFKIFHIFGLIYLLISVSYSLTPVAQRIVDFTKFTSAFNIFYSFSHYEKKLNKKVDLLNISRRYLPKGRYWLDTRDDPIYPLVHGDISAFCAYNNEDPKCQKREIKETKQVKVKEMPNIYFLIIESFNPFSYLINDDFIDEQSILNSSDERFYVTDTPYYNEKVLPNLAKYAKEGIVFSGLAAHGLPTLSGMHSLFTGVPPSQTYMNIIETADAHIDDFPSHFHDSDDYRTFYVTGTDFKYDGLHIWLNRRTAEEEAKIRLKCEDSSDMFDDPIQSKLMKKPSHLKKCTQTEIEELIKSKDLRSYPKWFDYLAGFFPDINQSLLMKLKEPVLTKTDWIADRVLSKEIQLIWKMQKEHLKRKQIKKPLFGVSINMETHIPYFGFDNIDQYEQINTKISRFSNEHKKHRFIRINKYTDKHYIGGMIDFLKKEDNNTIVVVLGDHGTRDIPVRRKKTMLTNKTRLSGDCYGKPSGIDSLFITSAAMLYLGDDENIKKELKLETLKGKTIKVATDHNDLIYTIMELVSRFKNKPLPPTHRLGRNLIDMSEDIVNTLKSNDIENSMSGPSKVIQKLNESNWQSISYLSYHIEYKRGTEFIRTHSAGPGGAHYYNVSSFPTCVKEKDADDMKLGGDNAKRMFNEMIDYLNVNNFLLYHNRVFNYNFRDEKCIKNGSCEFPPKLEHIVLHDSRLFAVLFTVPIAVSICGSMIIFFIRRKFSISYIENSNKKISDLENDV